MILSDKLYTYRILRKFILPSTVLKDTCKKSKIQKDIEKNIIKVITRIF